MGDSSIENPEEVQYVCEEPQFVLGPDGINADLSDIICADGSRAIFVNYVPNDNRAIFLQDSNEATNAEFYINKNLNKFVIEDSLSADGELGGAEIVQFVKNEDDLSNGQIIYFTDEDMDISNLVLDPSESNFGGLQDEDGNIYPFKRVKLENQILESDECTNENEIINELTETSNSSNLQYTFLENGEIQICAYEDTSNKPKNTTETFEDLSKITGKNLLTGQIVTLDSYMEKLMKKIDNEQLDISNETTKNYGMNFSGLLDKKISIGKTKSGKNIIGKIIHVENGSIQRGKSINNDLIQKESSNEIENQSKMTNIDNSDHLELISSTLTGLMDMESVRQRLECRNIGVKFVEKRFLNEKKFCAIVNCRLVKNVEYGEEKWKFIHNKDKKLNGVINVTINVVYDEENSRTIRVNLDAPPCKKCSTCGETFINRTALKSHLKDVHGVDAIFPILCDICGDFFRNSRLLQEHKRSHLNGGQLFACSNCQTVFNDKILLDAHLPCTKNKSEDKNRFINIMHQYPTKSFACGVCSRTFSRHSNLQRHLQIHEEPMFQCEICECSYKYASSLTRHMIQSHVVVDEKTTRKS